MPPRRAIRRRAIVLAVLVAVAIVPLAAATLLLGNGESAPATALSLHPVAGTFEPDRTLIEDCTDQRCFEQAYGNIAFREGPKPALQRFDEQYGDGSDPSCHRVVHMIGAASLSRYGGNVARTFAEGSASCWSGYYHGVLERALVGIRGYQPERLAGIARELCDDRGVRSVPALAYQCLHGLGHGLMISSGYDLPLSLEVCNRLASDWDQESCKGGVFMENMATSYGVRSSWIRDDDLVYPCNWVAPDDKRTCYQLVTSRILMAVGVDWERVARICGGVERDWVSACFQSFGRDVSGQSHRDPGTIAETCEVARPYGGERDCIRFAAMDMTANYAGGAEASVLCETTTPALSAPCFHAIGTIMGRESTTAAGRERDCRRVATTARDLAACVRGSTAGLPTGAGT